MKVKNYLLLMVLCAFAAILSSVTVHAQPDYAPVDDRYLLLYQKYFTMNEAVFGKWGQKNGFTYLYSEKNNTAEIVGIPLAQKTVTVPEKIDGKTVTKIYLMDVYRATEQEDYRYEIYDVEAGTWLVPKVEVLNIPKTVKNIYAYEGGSLNEGYCNGMQSMLMHLKKFNVASGNKWYKSYKGVLYTKNGKKLISVPRKCATKTVKVKKGTTKIVDSAFSNCTCIKKVILPDTVKVIEQNAFARCSLNYIRMPRKLKELDGRVFHHSALKKITVYGKVEMNETFKYCKNLKTVVLKEGVKELGEYVFLECPKLRSVTVPKSAKNLQCIDSTFYYRGYKCNLSKITVKTPKNSEMYKCRKFLKKRYKIKTKVIK